MNVDQFLRVKLAQPPGPEWPVLLRGVLYPLAEFIRERDVLDRYPAQVLYGGPLLQGQTTQPEFVALDRALLAWAMANGRRIATQTVPIAPPSFPVGSRAPAWQPGWRWWYAHERAPVPRYQLVATSPTHYDWRVT